MGSRKRRCLLATAIGCLLSPGAAWAWSPPIDLSPIQDFDQTPAAATNSQGDAVVAWSDRINGYQDVIGVTTRSAGGTWREDQTLAAPSDGSNTRPSVAIDSAGDALAVWSATNDQSRGETRAAYAPAGQAFGAPVLISGPETGNGEADAYVAFDSAGEATAFWEQNDGRLYYADRPTGGAFTAPQQVPIGASTSRANYPSYAVGGNGDAVVAWQEGYAIREGHGNFGPAQQLDPNAAAEGATAGGIVHVAMDRAGNAMAVWAEEMNGGPYWDMKAAVRRAGEPSFGAPVTIAEIYQGSGGAQVAFDRSGNATIVWPGESVVPYSDTGVSAVVYRASGGTFSDPIALGTPGAQDVPQVAYDDAGDAYVLWRHYDSDTEGSTTARVLAEEAPAGGTFPGEPETISSDDQNVWPPALAAAGATALAVWPIGDFNASQFHIQESDATPSDQAGAGGGSTTTTTTAATTPPQPPPTTTTTSTPTPPPPTTATTPPARPPAATTGSTLTTATAAPISGPAPGAEYQLPTTRQPQPTRMCVEPRLRGLQVGQARRRLTAAHCGVRIVRRPKAAARANVVLAVSGRPGARFPAGHAVQLTVAAVSSRR